MIIVYGKSLNCTEFVGVVDLSNLLVRELLLGEECEEEGHVYILLPHTTKFKTVNVQVLLRHTPSGSHWARDVSLIFTLFVRAFPYLSTLFNRSCCSHAILILHVLRHRARGKTSVAPRESAEAQDLEISPAIILP